MFNNVFAVIDKKKHHTEVRLNILLADKQEQMSECTTGVKNTHAF